MWDSIGGIWLSLILVAVILIGWVVFFWMWLDESFSEKAPPLINRALEDTHIYSLIFWGLYCLGLIFVVIDETSQPQTHTPGPPREFFAALKCLTFPFGIFVFLGRGYGNFDIPLSYATYFGSYAAYLGLYFLGFLLRRDWIRAVIILLLLILLSVNIIVFVK